jgi:lipoate-protein ligase A
VLFHGSFLLHCDVSLIQKVLPQPSQQPEYRMNRSHGDFLMNLKIPTLQLKNALLKAWDADQPLKPLPLDEIAALADEQYRKESWNLKF